MPLSTSQLAHLERRLREERERLLSQLHEFTNQEADEDTQDQAGDLSNLPMHMADQGTDVANEELEASIATRVSAELSEIDAALDRITNAPDTYGVDQNTGESIPFERLDIIPYARTIAAH